MILVEEHVVQIRHLHGVEPAEIIGALVEAGHFQGVDAHTGSPGSGPEFGADFQKLNTSHITLAEKRLEWLVGEVRAENLELRCYRSGLNSPTIHHLSSQFSILSSTYSMLAD